jgi:glutathione S-transferase
MLSIDVPDGYAYVFFTCGMLPSITNFLLGGKVMSARKKFNIPLPNLYATPGHHKEADAFNRVQRGHQHVLESISDFRTASFIGALKHPLVCAVSGVFYCLGNYMYSAGYADQSLDVKSARMKKGGPLQFIAQMVQIGCGVSACYSLLTQK